MISSLDATRDLLRRRLHLVRERGELLAHIQMTNQQYNLPAFAKRVAYRSNREGVADHFRGPRGACKSIGVDLAMLDRYDTLLVDLESYLVRHAKPHDPQAFQLLRSIPSVGKVLALTILYEIDTVHRFDRVQDAGPDPGSDDGLRSRDERAVRTIADRVAVSGTCLPT